SAAADHRLGMLGAEKPDRKINQWNIERTEYGEGRGQHLRLRAVREAPQHQIADVNQPENESGGEANISRRPPDAPHRARPQRSGHEHDGAENYSDFCRG